MTLSRAITGGLCAATFLAGCQQGTVYTKDTIAPSAFVEGLVAEQGAALANIPSPVAPQPAFFETGPGSAAPPAYRYESDLIPAPQPIIETFAAPEPIYQPAVTPSTGFGGDQAPVIESVAVEGAIPAPVFIDSVPAPFEATNSKIAATIPPILDAPVLDAPVFEAEVLAVQPFEAVYAPPVNQSFSTFVEPIDEVMPVTIEELALPNPSALDVQRATYGQPF